MDLNECKIQSQGELNDHERTGHSIETRKKSRKRIACELCPSTFSNIWGLRRHQSVHHSVIVCGTRECGKKFETLENRKEHEKQQHFYCDICDKPSKSEASFKEHNRRFHSDMKFKCQICLENFAKGEGLQKHQEKRHQSKNKKINTHDSTLTIFPVKEPENGNQKTREKIEEQHMQDGPTKDVDVSSTDPTDPTEEFNIFSSDSTGKIDVESSDPTENDVERNDPTENLKDCEKQYFHCDVCNKPFVSGESMKDHRYEAHFEDNTMHNTKNIVSSIDDTTLEMFNELQPVNDPVKKTIMNENLKTSENTEECHKQNDPTEKDVDESSDPTEKVIDGSSDNDVANQNIHLISHHNHLMTSVVDPYRLPSFQSTFILPYVQPPQPYGHIYGHQPMYDQQSYGQELIYGQQHCYDQQQAYDQQHGYQPIYGQQQVYELQIGGQHQTYDQQHQVHDQEASDQQQTFGKQQAYHKHSSPGL